MNKKAGTEELKKFIPFVILGIITIILVVRNRYTFCWSDESFYASNLYRISKGDKFFLDEWHYTVLSAYVVYPFYALYVLLKGSTEGVYLYLRDLCVLFSLIVSLMTYNCLIRKSFSKTAALLASVGVLIYSRANISGCSYYNMGFILFLTVAIVLYMDFYSHKTLIAILAGIILTMCIVTVPYVLPVLPVIFVFSFVLKKKEYLIMSISSGISGLLFGAYLILSIGIGNILGSKVLSTTGFNGSKLLQYFYDFGHFFAHTLIIQFFCLVINSVNGNKWIKRFTLACSTACLLFNLYNKRTLLGGAGISLIVFSLQLIPLVWKDMEEEKKRLIVYFAVVGLLFSYIVYMSSDTELDAATIGFTIVQISAILIIAETLGIIGESVLIIALMCTFFLRIFGVYRDDYLQNCTDLITRGPAKGLYTTAEHYAQYEDICADIDEYIKPLGSDTGLLVSKVAPWSYIYADTECASFTTWIVDMSDERLEEYYKTHPFPDVVLILDPEIGGYVDTYLGSWKTGKDLYPNDNQLEGFLWRYIQDNDYEINYCRSGMICSKQ